MSPALVKLLNTLRSFSRDQFTRNYVKQENVSVGEYTYGVPTIYNWTNKYKIILGKFCSIGTNVIIILDGNHRTDWISTYPFGHLIDGIAKNEGHPAGKGDIRIGNDVWIGSHVMILPGVSIGDGAVIGAGSVVTKNVDDYEIVAGNPAKHIRFRFRDDQISALKKIQWWNWDIEKIKSNIASIESENIDDFLKKFKA
jgi:acetyltransferase-like isoleucine patch superfamily enzyme